MITILYTLAKKHLRRPALLTIKLNILRGDFMVRPIAKTPIFEGEDAVAVLKEMQETPTKEDEEFAKEIRNQRIVLFSI